MSKSLSYRPDIDGLRAIAVIAVVVFHLKIFPLSGGFTGVDIFFTISGFLISTIIFKEAAGDGFSFYRFYERRARRILPAYFAVSAATLVAGYLMLFPNELVGLSKSLLASTFFAGNIYFFATSDYFAAAAEQQPLLHYWSLGVEEQFYVVFPLIIVGVLKWRPKLLPLTILVIIIASLVATQIALIRHPVAAFYLLPYRASELAIGAFVALFAEKKCSKPNWLALISIMLIVWSVVFLTDKSRFPGLLALPACIGTALAIWSGNQQSLVRDILSARPLVAIGCWSYSLYLIHWPLYVLSLRAYPDAPPLALGSCVLCLSVGLSWISYRFVEAPFRASGQRRTARNLSFAAAGIVTCAIVSSSIYAFDGFPGRINDRVAHLASFIGYSNLDQFSSFTCFMNENQTASQLDLAKCIPPAGSKAAMIWGDSGIAQYSQAFRTAFKDRGYEMGQLTLSACPPMLGYAFAPRPQCQAFNEFALQHILSLRPSVVVLGAAWPDDLDSYDHLRKTLKALANANISVVVLGEGPLYKRPVPTILAERLEAGNASVTSDGDLLDPATIEKKNELMASIISGFPNVRFIPQFDVLCPKRTCEMTIGNDPINFDIFHATAPGAVYFVSKFMDAIVARS